MNKTKIEWALNPDGTLGYTWNPVTGCLNGCDYCYARRLANTRLKERYLANDNLAPSQFDTLNPSANEIYNPFYPRFWPDKLAIPYQRVEAGRGIFVCDMSDLFGIGVPEHWIWGVLSVIKCHPKDRFYLLTKQPQNLIKFSPFPGNACVGVSATNSDMFDTAFRQLMAIEAKVKYISFEPLLDWTRTENLERPMRELDWVIIGQQTKPNFYPEWSWVKEIIDACDKAGIPVFLKNNLGLPKFSADGGIPYYKRCQSGTMELRQDMPK